MEVGTMDDLKKLATLFNEYQIYPKSKYTPGTPLKEFQKLYPNNHYTLEIEQILNEQDYPSIKRGADLPWWGKQFFQNTAGPKIMLIAQDSNASDAGSVVMYSHLFDEVPITSERNYSAFTNKLSSKDLFKYSNWKRAFQQIKDWELDPNHIYFTDAKKVYKNRIQGQKDKFDNTSCVYLLEKEIEITKPDYIITLGSQAFDLLSSTSLFEGKRLYSDAVECGEVIPLKQGKLIVSPFITGQCHTSYNFKNRMRTATELIYREIHNNFEPVH
jgi:hypothetical protein